MMARGFGVFGVRAAAAGAVAVLVASCALFQQQPEPPEIRVDGFRVVSADMLSQRYAVQLRVFNPNRFDVPIQDLVYRLDVEGEPFASGRMEPGPTLPAREEISLELTFETNLADTARRAMGWVMRGQTQLDYTVSGEARVRRVGMRIVQFEEAGTFSLDALRPRRR